jgi:hypothetical protein
MIEARLCSLVCSGALDIAVTQRAVADDWTEAYKKFFRTP